MKITKIYYALFLTLLVTTSCLAQAPTQTLSVSGLKDSVTVRRDERGIPYIEAKNEDDLFFAQGFVTAQDRLWQMDLYRRVARGETAEIFGRAVLEEDKRWRKFGFAKIADENLQYISVQNRRVLENYARGVNAYVATLDAKTLPVEFQILQYRPREWTISDSLVITKIFDDALSNTWRMDLMKASLMNLPKEKLNQILDPSSALDVLLIGKDDEVSKNRKAAVGQTIFNQEHLTAALFEKTSEIENARQNSLERIGFYAEELAASNNWVIGGKRTASGKPILANDPHLRPTQPPIWYLVQLGTPDFRVAGVSTAGIPGVILGHNEQIAWGATNVGPDVQDLYLETFNPNGEYKTPKGWEKPIVRREEIKVRKSVVSPETETEILEVASTRNGVIFLEEAGKRYALKWTSLDAKNTFIDFLVLARAKNWSDFRAALKNYGGAMQNFIYADAQGNIGWIAAGKVPLRKTGDGSLPYDGATDDGEWTGFIPFEDLPQLYNPPTNFIMTANQRTVGKSYKYHNIVARAHTVARAPRLQNLLEANQKITVENVSDYQFDTFSVINSRFAAEVVKQKAASVETLKLFSAWDGRMNADSKAALIADRMRSEFRNKILSGNFGVEQAKNLFLPYEAAFFDRLITEKPKEWLPKEFASYADLLRLCEKDAFASLKLEAQNRKISVEEASWNWGTFVKTTFSHPLAVAPLIGAQFLVESLPQNGSGGTAASPNVGAAVSMRHISTPGDWDATRFVIPTGESGNPASPHYKDQLKDWASGNAPIFPFSKPAIEKAARETILLTPKN